MFQTQPSAFSQTSSIFATPQQQPQQQQQFTSFTQQPQQQFPSFTQQPQQQPSPFSQQKFPQLQQPFSSFTQPTQQFPSFTQQAQQQPSQFPQQQFPQQQQQAFMQQQQSFLQQQQPQQQPQQLQDPLVARLRNIHLAYTSLIDQNGNPACKADESIKLVVPNDEKCEFDALMYERKSEAIKSIKHKLSKRRQDIADYNNPDSSNCVAIRLLGINELTERYRKQEKDSQSVLAYVESLENHLSRLREIYSTEVSRFQALKSKQANLHNRSLSVMRNVEVLRCYKVSFTQKEQICKERLLSLGQKIKSSQDRLVHLISLDRESSSSSSSGSTATSTALTTTQSQQSYTSSMDNHALMTSLDLDSICSTLDKQRTGLSVLTDILTKNTRDVKIMKKELNLLD